MCLIWGCCAVTADLMLHWSCNMISTKCACIGQLLQHSIKCWPARMPYGSSTCKLQHCSNSEQSKAELDFSKEGLTSSGSIEESICPCEGTLGYACPCLQQLLHHCSMPTVGCIVKGCGAIGGLQVYLQSTIAHICCISSSVCNIGHTSNDRSCTRQGNTPQVAFFLKYKPQLF